MNMLTMNNSSYKNSKKPFIAQAVVAVETLASDAREQKTCQGKQILDELFPLETGSHQEVTAYMIDYRHLVAYFKDGTHTGLRHPKHFVAYNGEKETPCSILLRDGKGSHVEVMIGCNRGTGCVELTTIEDIQIECSSTLSQQNSPCHFAMRHWISLIKSDRKDKPAARSEDKEFTAKDGNDYVLETSYQL